MVLVDSSVWIEAARRDGDLKYKVGLEGLLEEYEATLCCPVRIEVLSGARREDRRRLEAAFAILPFIPVSQRTWELALVHAWKLRDAGITPPWNDLLIATLSMQQACRVYANDRHFEQMSQVIGVRLYEAGYGGSFTAEPSI